MSIVLQQNYSHRDPCCSFVELILSHGISFFFFTGLETGTVGAIAGLLGSQPTAEDPDSTGARVAQSQMAVES